MEGAVAVVTGAGRGIGRAIAKELGAGGAKVVVNYSSSKEPAEEVVKTLSENGAQGAVAVQADVAGAEQAARLIEDTIEEFGRIDVLINSAGITIDRTMRKLNTEDWDKVVQVDLNSCYYTVKPALSYFIEQESGDIINIKSAALELARYNVTVNAVCPGFIETEMIDVVPDNVKERIRARIPLGRIGEPRDIARAVRYLIVDGGYITGQTISINGGIYM
ncbi:MAG: 3-oxoacyl-ACP reductase FabG [Actinomycetota bacterium]|nr:3-oxoacyl-ACP reductase FabG [Actinomycetota bacterium]